MNTAEITDIAEFENELARDCILRGVGAIGRGRRPFARARLEGKEQGGGVSGNVSFYYTPLGMLVCVAIGGLKKDRGVYTLSLSSCDGGRRTDMRCAVPPLYARGGYAWCSVLTGKLLPSEVSECTALIKELGGHTNTVASGRVMRVEG